MKMKQVAKKQLLPVLSCSALAVATLSGCASSPTRNQQSETLVDRGGIDIVAADSTRQLTYLKDRGATDRFCRGPGADAMHTGSEGVSVQLPAQGLGLGEQETLGAVDLGGRSPAVLIARELMYRACELATNTNADGATEREIYLQFLQAVVSISNAQGGMGAAGLASNPAAPVLPALPSAAPVSTTPTPASASDFPIPGSD